MGGEERRAQEAWAQVKIREGGACIQGFGMVRVEGGFRCCGEVFFSLEGGEMGKGRRGTE